MTHVDSSLLIDLQRELARDRPGPAFDLEDAPLLTANMKDFARVPGLRLIRY